MTALAPLSELNDLSREQWAATLHAARILREADPNDPEDRARFRSAKARMVALLPEGTDAIDMIGKAVRWYALNDIAAAIACSPEAEVA